MKECRKIRTANSVVNLTDTEFNMYDDVTGDICNFPPCDMEVPERPTIFKNGLPVFYYVVTEEAYKRLVDSERQVYDVAVLQELNTGRGGVKIATLYWAENPEFKIRISRKQTFLK